MRTEFSSALLGERYDRIEHASGLSVYVFPKKLTTTYAVLATHFGSINNAFRTSVESEVRRVPNGIAHFLEHKLFENEDGSDSFERFAALGADANAYTSYERTAYLFSCTENFDACLEELLRFVTHPHFTEASVKKEQGIIAQEICEYEDSPWERCFQNLLEAMYCEHPIRNNICGSVESIGKITPELLDTCYRAFYRPSNMVLAVCGDLDPGEVMAIVDRMMPSVSDGAPMEQVFPNEPFAVGKAYTEERMPVSKPIFSIGIKDPAVPTDPQERFRRDMTLALLDDVLFSRAGEFYSTLFEEGVITPNFAGGYSCAEGFGFHCISGESDTPELVLERLRAHLDRICREGIPEEDFERCRRVMYADELRAFDSTEEIASRIVSYALDGVELFSYLPILSEIRREEAEGLLREMLNGELFTLSVIRPTEQDA